jgi:hypothetical protein
MTAPASDFALYRAKLSTFTATKLRSSSVRLGASKTRPKGEHVHMTLSCVVLVAGHIRTPTIVLIAREVLHNCMLILPK